MSSSSKNQEDEDLKQKSPTLSSNHAFTFDVKTDPIAILENLRENISKLDVRNSVALQEENEIIDEDINMKIKKRNPEPFNSIFEEIYEDYDDDYEEPAWTKVGNGRVKIIPLSFGKKPIKINMYIKKIRLTPSCRE